MSTATSLKTYSDTLRSHAGRITEAVIVFSILVYASIGAFPIVPLENDSMRISLGAQSHDIYGSYQYAYEHDAQPGTYIIIEFVANTFEADHFRTFSLLTYISSILFLLISSVFLKRITGNHFLFAFISIILFQETFVSGYYPNSSMIAAMFFSIAILLATKKESFAMAALAGFTFAIALWVRFDTIIMFPAFPLLLLGRSQRDIKAFALFCVATLATSMLIFFACDASMVNIVRAYAEHKTHSIDIKATLNNYTTVFTLAVIFGYGVGLYKLYKIRSWRQIALSILVPLPVAFIYGLCLVSPKYLLYATILWAIPITYSIDEAFANKNQIVKLLGIVLFAGQYIFSPPYELILGRSTVVFTADEARLRGAIAFTPIYYAKHRRATFDKDSIFQNKLNQFIEQQDTAYILSHDWMTNQWILCFLQNANYRIRESENFADLLEDGQRLILSRGSDTVYLVRSRPQQALELPDFLQREIENMPTLLFFGPDYTTTDESEISCLTEKFDWQVLPDWGRFETILITQK